jgi:hypothetical protein
MLVSRDKKCQIVSITPFIAKIIFHFLKQSQAVPSLVIESIFSQCRDCLNALLDFDEESLETLPSASMLCKHFGEDFSPDN